MRYCTPECAALVAAFAAFSAARFSAIRIRAFSRSTAAAASP
jgi:hypothetical protein